MSPTGTASSGPPRSVPARPTPPGGPSAPTHRGAQHGLDLAELGGLEPRRRFEPVPERGELERGHRLEDVDLGDERLEDLQDAVEQVEGPVGICRLQGPLDLRQLVEQLLEPQLIDLVDHDEQQLVVLGAAVRANRKRSLGRQHLVECEIRRVVDGSPGHSGGDAAGESATIDVSKRPARARLIAPS